jgi:hypothetical protein
VAIIPIDPETMLLRSDAAAALTKAGYPTAPATLATLASRGGGPVYRRYGSRAIYRWGDLREWAQSRLGAPMRSTSEADARDTVSPDAGVSQATGSSQRQQADA